MLDQLSRPIADDIGGKRNRGGTLWIVVSRRFSKNRKLKPLLDFRLSESVNAVIK